MDFATGQMSWPATWHTASRKRDCLTVEADPMPIKNTSTTKITSRSEQIACQNDEGQLFVSENLASPNLSFSFNRGNIAEPVGKATKKSPLNKQMTLGSTFCGQAHGPALKHLLEVIKAAFRRSSR
jgi:hypothetical protein